MSSEMAAVLAAVAPAFWAQGCERVYVASCCGRVLVTLAPPNKCRTCGKVPQGEWVERPC